MTDAAVSPDTERFTFTENGPWVLDRDSLELRDLAAGMAKTPFFGFLITLLGCYFGLETRGGTEGVGRSTTRSVVVVSITVLVADALLTQIFVSL